MSNIIYNFNTENFIVTGASSGIGRQIAIELAEAGARILVIARRKDELEVLKNKYPDNIYISNTDVNNIERIKKDIQNFVAKYGKFNGLVHAAGIDGKTPLKYYDKFLAEKIMETSFWSVVDIIQVFQKKKYSEENSSIVLFSSVASKSGEASMFAYSASKAAVSNLVKSLAKEIFKRRIRINAICPGWVDTPMTNGINNEDVFNRHLLGTGTVNDISGVVLFLLSDRASWITGSDIIVDGGYLAN